MNNMKVIVYLKRPIDEVGSQNLDNIVVKRYTKETIKEVSNEHFDIDHRIIEV